MATLPSVKPFETASSMNSYNSQGFPSTSTSKSKFWQLFNWRKTGNHEQDVSSMYKQDLPTPTLPSQPPPNQSRPSLAVRSKSESIVPRKHRTPSKSLQSRKKSAVSANPPPLVQAYSQAIIHSTLEVPCSPTERGLSRPTSSSSKEPSSANSQDTRNDLIKAHQRTGSRSSLSSLREKLLFLTGTGYVLQYDVSGNGNRLPEKILELNKEAVAFASDALPGRPWVLQISSKASLADASQPPSLKKSRSKLSLRLLEPKRNTDTLYLVFDDPEDLYSWLFSVRKEIESLGGMEYRPDTRGAGDRQFIPAVQRQSKVVPALQRLSRSSSALPLSPSADTESATTSGTYLQAPDMQRSMSSHSETSSSTESTTVDKLRDSMFSESYPSTTTTSACSPKSMSPTQETFNMNSLSSDLQSKPMPALPPVQIDSVTERMASLNVQRPTIQERRQMSVSNSSQPESSKTPVNQDKDLPEPPPQSPDDGKDRPLSVVAPLPDPSCLPRSSRNGSRKCSVDEGKTMVDTVQEKSHASQPRDARRKSTINGNGELPKAKYSLFPTPASVPPIELVKPTTPPEEDTDTKMKQHRKGRSRTLTLNLPRAASPPRLSPTTAEFSKAQRSPAVTIEMIEANFGATPLPNTPSPISHHRVPSLSDLGIDEDLTATPSDSSNSPPSKQRPRKLSSMKSMPNMDVDTAASFAKAPAGPPPSGPLPAVPADASPVSGRRSSGNSEHTKIGRSSSSRVHSRNPSSTHSRNPSIAYSRGIQGTNARPRNASDGSNSSSCSSESSINQPSHSVSREECGPMFPPRTSSTRHLTNRSGGPPRAIDTHRQRQWSRSSIVACAM